MIEIQKKKVAAIILAAGSGTRAQTEFLPKQYKKLGNHSILTRTLDIFLSCQDIDHVTVAIGKNDMDFFYHAVGSLADHVQVVFGGNTRQESAFYALNALQDICPEIVLIHDGVRPFINSDLITRIIHNVSLNSAVVPALPVTETLKRTDGSQYILEIINRDNLYTAQTPQGFSYQSIMQAHKMAQSENLLNFTDDSSLAKWAGMKVKFIQGCLHNRKLTWPEDMSMAQNYIKNNSPFPDVRTGNGYDVHAFQDGDHVVLCGLCIPHSHALSGHSDADVAFHALTDALLGTCGAQDIGAHFPPSDPKWLGATSSIFLEHALQIIYEKKGKVLNVDISLICESPKISPYREAMIENLMKILKISQNRISIKATTNEKLGFIGRKEGIAALATASVLYSEEDFF